MSASPLDLTGPEVRAQRRGRFWMRGLRSAGYGALIGLLITGLTGQSFWITMIHSVCIAMLCWAFIDLGRVPLARWKHRNAPDGSAEAESNWPGWPLMLGNVAFGSMLGFVLGGTLASWLTNRPAPGYLRGDLAQIQASRPGAISQALSGLQTADQQRQALEQNQLLAPFVLGDKVEQYPGTDPLTAPLVVDCA